MPRRVRLSQVRGSDGCGTPSCINGRIQCKHNASGSCNKRADGKPCPGGQPCPTCEHNAKVSGDKKSSS